MRRKHTANFFRAIWLAGIGASCLVLPMLWWCGLEVKTFAEASQANLQLGLCAAATVLWGGAGFLWFKGHRQNAINRD